MADFIPLIDEVLAAEPALAPATPPPPTLPASPSSVIVISYDEVVEEDPEEVEFASGHESTNSDKATVDIDMNPPHSRPACVNVFMPYVPLEHFDNIAYAYVNPPLPTRHLSSIAP